MSDEHDLRRQAEKGARAQSLWGNETLQGAFEKVENDLLTVWKQTKLGATADREALYHQFAALQEVKSAIRSQIDAGKRAKSALERLKQGVKAAFG